MQEGKVRPPLFFDGRTVTIPATPPPERLVRVIHTLDAISIRSGKLFAWLIFPMVASLVYEVVARYVFNAPLHGTVEIVSSYYMVAVVFLPLAMIERLNGHIVVELVTQHLPRRGQDALIGIVALVSALYFATFAWRTWGDALNKYAVGESALGTVQVTIWPTRFYLPIGCGRAILVLTAYSGSLS